MMQVDEIPNAIEGPDGEEEWGGISGDDDMPDFFAGSKAKNVRGQANPARRRKGKVAELVREKVRRVLEDETELADTRARMCDENDFLKLLYAFNKEGIHFS